MDIVYNKVYSADIFNKIEMDAYFSQAQVGDRILLQAKNIKALRSRIAKYEKRKKLIITTTKIEKNIIEVEFGGNLYIKKPLNYHRRPHKDSLTLSG